MTNSLLIYEESGYLFNDTTKRLEWFEIDKILISFTYGVVRYIGTWGGCRTDKMLEGERFYSSEECFKNGDIISDWFSDNGMGARGCRLCINIPEYTAFKDGDVLSNEEGDYLFILNTNGEYLTSHYASWKKGSYLHLNNGHADQNNIERYRFATKDERQEFIDALKISKEPKAKIYLKQFFGIEIEPKYKFKPFDKVLVRDTEKDDWHVSLFVRKIANAQYKEERYECLNGMGWIYCIPYEGNEHLL